MLGVLHEVRELLVVVVFAFAAFAGWVMLGRFYRGGDLVSGPRMPRY